MTLLYIRGNYNYGTPDMHEELENEIKTIAKEVGFNFIVMDSDKPVNKDTIKYIESIADVVIGFSRGTRYFKRIRGVKIGIGSKKGTYSFINRQDKTSEGDISKESLESHFTIAKENRKKIINILKTLKG